MRSQLSSRMLQVEGRLLNQEPAAMVVAALPLLPIPWLQHQVMPASLLYRYIVVDVYCLTRIAVL